jgi:hypothetical protein
VAVVVEGSLVPLARLRGFPSSGLAPLGVRFRPATTGGTTYSVDLEGDGTFEYVGGDLDDREFVYHTPGVYLATILSVTPDGLQSALNSIVTVFDRAEVETAVRATFSAFRRALQAHDVAHAVGFIHSGRREAWDAYLRQFTPAMFDATGAVFTEVTLLDVSSDRAESEMMREVGGLMYSYPVSFALDADGRWRLWQF